MLTKEKINGHISILIGIIFLIALFASAQTVAAKKTVRIILPKAPHTTHLGDLVGDFEKKTGIKAKVDYFPEVPYMTKVKMLMATESDEYDVVYIAHRHIAEAMHGGWVKPLDGFIKGSKDFDWNDFPGGVKKIFSKDAVPYCIPNFNGGFILYYNKDMFKEAGLTTPPRTIEEFEAYAKKLHKPDKGQYGVALRATREGMLGSATWIIMLMSQGGYYWNDKMEPQLDSPLAINTTETWARILNKYGPPGVSSYGWEEVALAFEMGKVGMIIDDSIFGTARFENPKQSKIVGKIGYDYLRSTKVNEYVLFGAWGFSILKNAKNQDLAWEYIKHAVSTETCEYAITKGHASVARISVLKGDKIKQYVPAEWGAAVAGAMDHANPLWAPPIPEFRRIREQIAIAIDYVLSGQKSSEEAMKEANKATYDILKEAGYIK